MYVRHRCWLRCCDHLELDADTGVQRGIQAHQAEWGQPSSGTLPGGLQSCCACFDRHCTERYLARPSAEELAKAMEILVECGVVREVESGWLSIDYPLTKLPFKSPAVMAGEPKRKQPH